MFSREGGKGLRVCGKAERWLMEGLGARRGGR